MPFHFDFLIKTNIKQCQASNPGLCVCSTKYTSGQLQTLHHCSLQPASTVSFENGKENIWRWIRLGYVLFVCLISTWLRLIGNTGVRVINEQPSSSHQSKRPAKENPLLSSSCHPPLSRSPSQFVLLLYTTNGKLFMCNKFSKNKHKIIMSQPSWFPVSFFLSPLFFFTHTHRGNLLLNSQSWKKKSLEVSYYIKPQLLLLNPWGRDSNLIVLFWGQVSSNDEKLSILLNYRQVLKVILMLFGVGAKSRASHMLCIRFDICVLYLQSLDFNNALTIASTTMYCLWISVLYDRSILVQWECRAGSPRCTNQLTNRPPKTQHKGLWVGPLMAPKQKTR